MTMKLERWLDFLKVDTQSTAPLKSFVDKIEPHMDAILDVFYERIMASQAAALFTTPQSMERARRAQRNHWLTYVLCGNFDAAYAKASRTIGQTHYLVGVDLMTYTGAYSVVLNELVDLIATLYRDSPEQARLTHRAVNQVVFLDMGLATSVYYDSFLGALEDMSNELNYSLARAGEYRDNETGMHLMRMSRMCHALALDLGKDQKWAQMILIASPLHDVGKIGIPDNILLKPGRLDSDELKVMRCHPDIGGSIIPDHAADVIRMAKRIALTHHEKWDGTGYPAGLRGEEIPLEGRIAAICDVYDALLSERPYKKPWTQEQAVDFLYQNSGVHFDPHLVEIFLSNKSRMDEIRSRYDDDNPTAEVEKVLATAN